LAQLGRCDRNSGGDLGVDCGYLAAWVRIMKALAMIKRDSPVEKEIFP
jgi:hypothetical protein